MYSFSLFFFASLLFTAICKASLDSHFVFFSLLFLRDGLDLCLLYNVTNLRPYFIRHSVYHIQSLKSISQNEPGQRLIEFAKRMHWSQQTPSSNNTREDSTHGHHQMALDDYWYILFGKSLQKCTFGNAFVQHSQSRYQTKFSIQENVCLQLSLYLYLEEISSFKH